MAKVKEAEVKPIVGPRSKTDMIRVRIDPTLKADAEAILATLGLNASDAIRLFYAQITLAEGLPFPEKIPNAEAREAMRAADAGEGTHSASVAEMFQELGL